MNNHWKRLAGIAQGAVALLAAYFVLPAGAASIQKRQQAAVSGAGRAINLEIFTYRPKKCTVTAVLLVFHGVHRNLDAYRDDLHSLANEFCMLEVVPLFDEQLFPWWRYRKGGIAHQGVAMPSDGWSGDLVIGLVDRIRKDENRLGLPYVMVGHSAGSPILESICRVYSQAGDGHRDRQSVHARDS